MAKKELWCISGLYKLNYEKCHAFLNTNLILGCINRRSHSILLDAGVVSAVLLCFGHHHVKKHIYKSERAQRKAAKKKKTGPVRII